MILDPFRYSKWGNRAMSREVMSSGARESDVSYHTRELERIERGSEGGHGGRKGRGTLF